MKKNKLLVPIITSAALLSAGATTLFSCGCNNKKPDGDGYDISITEEDKIGYITNTVKPYFEFYLTIKGLRTGDKISSKITASTKQKVKIADEWVEHIVTEQEAEDEFIKLKVVPINDSPDQPVFTDIFSIKFTFKCEEEECFEKTIDDFSIDAAIATKESYFNAHEDDVTGEVTITGFNRSFEQALYDCGVLVIPPNISYIAENAFNPQISGHEWYADVFKNIRWLLLDPTFEGAGGSKCLLKEIGANAFAGCPLIETLYIPSTVEKINSDAFSGCDFSHFEYMGNYTGTGNLKYIGYRAFKSCRFDGTLWLPKCNNYTRVYGESFACFSPFPGLKAKKLVIPNNIQKFDTNAFRGYDELEVIDLSDYSTVPDSSGFSQYSFTNFPRQGKIYVKSAGLIQGWKDVLSQKNVFEDFVKGTWTIEVKE